MAASKNYSLAAGILSASLGVVGSALAQSSIGFVSLERILREAPAAQRAQKKLEQEFSQRGQELSKTADQLKKMQGNLEKNAVTMSESERQKREREFGDVNRDFQRRQREFNEDLAQRRKEESGSERKLRSIGPRTRQPGREADRGGGKTRRRVPERAGRVGEHPHRHHGQGHQGARGYPRGQVIRRDATHFAYLSAW